MNFEKALRIFDLKPNFTEEELKKAHRELANKYHPDRNKTPKSEEMMKNINEARDCLYNFLKTGKKPNYSEYNQYQNNYNPNNFGIKGYQLKKIRELHNVIEFDINKYNISDNIKQIIKKIEDIYFEFTIYLITLDTKLEIDNSYNQYLSKIIEIFKELKEEFLKENYINETDIKENIEYNCTLTEFYEQLLKIKDKYNKENQKKIELKKNERKINQIYQSLINRYSDEIKKCNIIVTEQSQINIQLKLLKELLELFIKGCKEFKDLNYFNLFNEITFTDIEKDNKIKQKIEKQEKENKQSSQQSYKHYKSDINDKFYEIIFGKPEFNTDDTYGYDNQRRSR